MDILKQNKRTVFLLIAVILAGTCLQILAPRFLSAFIDKAEYKAPVTAIALMIAGYLATVLAQKGTGICEVYLSSRLGGENHKPDKAPNAGTFYLFTHDRPRNLQQR